MNRITLAAAVAIALTGCTVQQRQMAANALADDPAPVTTEAPTNTVVADCDRVTYTVHGEPGDTVYIGIDSQPPWSNIVDDTGTATGWDGVGYYDSHQVYTWIIDIGDTRLTGTVDCTG